jgi:hypothetical protein
MESRTTSNVGAAIVRCVRLTLALPLLACTSAAAVAGATNDVAVLRQEAGFHSAPIKGVAVDPAGAWIATCSDDKTIRIWSTADARSLGILRPPIDAENDGRLYAIAASPDGRILVSGGWTGLAWTGGHVVYVYQRESGKLVKRVGAFSNVVLSLAFSRDGRFLAVGLARGAGIAVFSTANWDLVGTDRSFQSDVYALDWGEGGLLIAAGLDGLVRSYKVDGSTVTTATSRRRDDKLGVRTLKVSPDGRLMALTYAGKASVELLRADSLVEVDTLAMADATRGAISHLAWTRDSRALYAAGSVSSIRRWDLPSKMASDIPVFGGPVTALGVSQGALFVATAQPAVGALSLEGKPLWQRVAGTWPFNPGSTLRVSKNGLLAEVAVEPPPGKDRREKILRIDLSRREFKIDDDAPSPGPRDTAISGTTEDGGPQFRGKRLALRDLERGRTDAVAPGGKLALIGTDWGLTAFDEAGQPAWRWSSPAPVRSVGVSGSGQFTVAALSNGTVHWLDSRSGVLLLSALATRVRPRWILWTADGNYEAGPGGEDLLGWHVNGDSGKGSTFVPASQMRKTLSALDIVATALAPKEISAAASQTKAAAEPSVAANGPVAENSVKDPTLSVARLPPVVELKETQFPAPPQGGAVRIPYVVRFPAEAPATGLRVRIDGLASDAEFSPDQKATTATMAAGVARVPIPAIDDGEGELSVELFAESANGTSAPATAKVTFRAKRIEQPSAVDVRPKLYMLVIGVSKYRNADLSLEFPSKDAEDFASTMSLQKGRLFRDAEVRLLRDGAATRDAVLGGLEWLKRAVTSRDFGVLFMAGHGINDETGGYYFLPVDFALDEYKRTAVPFTEIKDTMVNLAGKALFFIDSCHSGNALGGGGRRAIESPQVTRIVNELSSAENGVVVFSSSTGRQVSLEHRKWGNGAFTKALVEGLLGGADLTRSGRVTHRMLDLFISERVKELTQGKQTPVSQAPGGVPDFPVALTNDPAGR